MGDLTQLLAQLANTPAGPVPKEREKEIISLLAACWDELAGSGGSAMKARKVYRAEGLEWAPPRLIFTMERHGAVVFDSKRAELQRWVVDLETKTADCSQKGFRYLRPPAPKLDVKPIVASVCAAVQAGPASSSDLIANGALVWVGDDEVRIKQSILILGGGAQQTVENRRRRFRVEMDRGMKELGWEKTATTPSLKFRKQSHNK
jgi:hypothetical protein